MSEPRFDRFMDRLRGLSVVGRWNFHPRLTTETVAEHSFYVGFYAAMLAMMDGVRDHILLDVVMSAICHDFEESVTGDLPMLVKREVKNEWVAVEDRAMSQLLQFLPHDLAKAIGHRKFVSGINGDDAERVKKYVKAADILDVIMYCRSEKALGNKSFLEIEQEASTLLRRMDMESVNKILDAYCYPRFEHSAVELPVDMTHG